MLYSRQPATLNYLICSADPDLYHGTHCVDTLVEYDSRGKIREGLATSWEWDADTLTWTFHLRDENWVDYTGAVLGPVTAQDFVDALAYLLNPDYASGTASLVTPYVAGAEDYYNYCVWRNNANNGTVAEDGTTYTIDAAGTVTLTAADGSTTTCPAVDFSSVGVAAADEHTLTYTLNYDFPGFLSLLNYAPFEPAYGPMLAELGDQFCTSAETACNCGAFYLAEYTPLESWVMKKNPENYDKDNVYIDTIRYIYNQEALISGPEMVRRGEIDQATISSDILDSWLADDTTKDMVSMDRPETGKSYFYFFNFLPYAHSFSNWNTTGVDAQYQPDNWAKAVNSTNFRKSFLYAINPAGRVRKLQAAHHHPALLLRRQQGRGLYGMRRACQGDRPLQRSHRQAVPRRRRAGADRCGGHLPHQGTVPLQPRRGGLGQAVSGVQAAGRGRIERRFRLCGYYHHAGAVG